MTSNKKVFIVGPGFIGWEVLDLLVAEGYKVKALVRRKEAGEDITGSGAEPIIGGLHDSKLITAQTAESDIVIHTATADDLPSVKAILAGVEQRAAKGLSTIYLHNSGAAVFDDGAAGEHATDEVWSDDDPKRIDSIKDTAPHRDVDLAILKVKLNLGDKAKIAIILPPLIYGFNPKHGRLSIQIPMLARYAIQNGQSVHIGQGKSVMSTVHVLDLARAYILILHYLEETPGTSVELANPYFFAEADGDNEPSWHDIAVVIGEGLFKAGRIKDAAPTTLPTTQYGELLGDITPVVWGLNSRTRTARLKKLGWKPTEKSWKDSFLEDELPHLLKE